MALTIANNVASLNAQNNLSKTTGLLNQSLERLSSGLKINSGADGPAALVISEQQRAQMAGLQSAIDNTNKAVSLVQTGEGALSEINSLLDKARSLAVDSANSGVDDSDALAANQSEITNILSTITNIASTTQFGSSRKLLDGSSGLVVDSAPTGVTATTTSGLTQSGAITFTSFQQAAKASATGGTGTTAFSGVTGGTAGNLVINGVTIALNTTNASNLTDTINQINSFGSETGVTAQVNTAGDGLNLVSNTFGTAGNFTVGASSTTATLTALGIAAGTTTNGADASGTATFTPAGGGGTPTTGIIATGSGNTLTFNSGPVQGMSLTLAAGTGNNSVGSNGMQVSFTNNSLVFQIGANAGQTSTVSFQDMRSTAIGQNASGTTTGVSSLSGIDVTTQAGAQDSIRVIDKAISDVSNFRGDLGAFQANTLESNAANLQTTLENTTAAESTIRDTDYASEIANYTKYQLQMQAGTSVLSNANQTSQLVAQLLHG